MKLRILQTSALSIVVALVMAGGCTEPPLGWPGAGRLQELPGPANDASGIADGEGGPATLPGLCVPEGVICDSNADCCDNMCLGHACGGLAKGHSGPLCAPDGVVCVHSSDCCGGNPTGGSTDTNYCGGGVCGATPAPVCIPEFVTCHDSMECCNSSSMDGGATSGIVCGPHGACCGVEEDCSSDIALCVPFGVFCTTDTDCCSPFKCSLNMNLQLVCDIPPP